MSIAATHFAPKLPNARARWQSGSPPLICMTAMAGGPELVRAAYGETVLAKANRDIMLDTDVIADNDCFIPHATMVGFVDAVAKHAGDGDLGLVLAPHLSISNYGCWGAYILGAPTLGGAINRLIGAMGLHSRGDRASLLPGKDVARLCYSSAARPLAGYRHLAPGVAGVLTSLCRAYLGPAWLPLRIELDIPGPRHGSRFEDVFACPVVFGAPIVAVCLKTAELGARPSLHRAAPLVLLEDVARARLRRTDSDKRLCAITEYVWTQVLSGAVSIESTARALDTSVRSLQRDLNSEGVAFRTLVTAARSQRGMHLLHGSDMSITAIAAHLGYASPAHFARAFRASTGHSPSEYRRTTSLASETTDMKA